jgi:hypothetical protein
MKSRFDAIYKARFRPQKRRWWYAQPPWVYEVAPCPCGNAKTQWSEWRHMLWCERCRKDFVPEHNGIFDGPIPLRVAGMMGIRFDRIYAKNNRLVRQEAYLSKSD